jgi:small subunit ribosomal protein S8
MSQVHLLSDGLTRIRNAHLVKKAFVLLYHSKNVKNVLDVLFKEGYINKVEEYEEKKGIFKLKVSLKYYDSESSAISEINVVSKPGKRVYKSYKDLGRFFNGLGVYILTTPKGVMTDNEARKMKVGGEVLCNVL